MLDQLLRRKPLFLPQLADELDAFQRSAVLPLVGNLKLGTHPLNRLNSIVKTSTRKDEIVVAVNAAVDDPRRAVDVQTKPLHIGIYGIHKRCKAY